MGQRPESTQGFKAINWKAKPDSDVVRQFFVRVHTVSEPTRRKPVGRTILVMNMPQFVSADNLKKTFSAFGDVKEVFLHKKPTTAIPDARDKFFRLEKDTVGRGYKVGYVVFKDLRSVKDLMALDDSVAPLVLAGEIVSGIKKWTQEYNANFIDPKILEEDVKQYMVDFEKEEVRRKEAEKLQSEADDEGWITVTSQGKKAGTKRTESTQEKLKAKKRRMEKAVLNITPAQIKATKAKQLEDLKKKFDEDKQKIALLKQQRKFKPF